MFNVYHLGKNITDTTNGKKYEYKRSIGNNPTKTSYRNSFIEIKMLYAIEFNRFQKQK